MAVQGDTKWQAVCLTGEHHSFSTKPYPTYVAAAKVMAKRHPECPFELVALSDAPAPSWVDRIGFPTDELVD